MKNIVDWRRQNRWLRGANYLPRTAINPLEMWRRETYDPVVIDQELGWARSLGFNAMRVFLHNLVWDHEGQEYLDRFDHFLGLCGQHSIRVMPVFFDGVWNPVGRYGEQPPPVPHRHNSGWTQCPTGAQLADPQARPRLEAYVKAFLTRFGDDPRIAVWDLYNEPDNTNDGRFLATEPPDKKELALALARDVFRWTESVDPSQPWTIGIWKGDWSDPETLSPLEHLMVERSPIISFHCYGAMEEFKAKVESLERYGKHLICTEYMARNQNNTIAAMLPYMKEKNVDAFNWGFVSGKSQTIFPWDSWQRSYDGEPTPWFHDLLRPDGTPYLQSEWNAVTKLCRG